MIALAIRRPVATLMVFGALTAIGIASALRLPLELLPEVAFPRLEITTLWPGASPEMVEAFVTAPIEAEAHGVRSVQSVSSISYAQRSVVTVEFERGTDMQFARFELSERLGTLATELPAAAHSPEVAPYVPQEFADETDALLIYTLAGQSTLGALRETAKAVVKPELLAVDGISTVEVVGGSEMELRVRLRTDRLQVHGLTPGDIRRALATSLNVTESGGTMRRRGLDTTVAVDDRARGARDVETLVLPHADASRSSYAPGAPMVRLGDVADAVLTYGEPRDYHRVDGHSAVSLYAYREPGSDVIAIARAARRQLGEIEARLPQGTRLIQDRDGSEPIREELADLGARSAVAAAIVFGVLWVAFRGLKPAVLAFGTIAASTLITLTFLWVGGLTLNLLTLAALAMGFGFIVDNAIVVLDGIEVECGAGRSGVEAAELGARKVALPVLTSTATNIIVFVPFLYLQGELRAYYVPFAVTAGLVLLASVAVSFGALPVLSSRSGGIVRTHGGAVGTRNGPNPAGPRKESVPLQLYGRIVWLTVGHPYTAVLLATACFGASAYFFLEHVPRGRGWNGWGEETYLSIQVEMPRGTEIERTDALTRRIEARLETIPEVERYVTRVRDEYASIRVTFPDSLSATWVPVTIKERLIAWMHAFGGVDVRVYGFGPSFYGEGKARPSYSLKLLGYNYRELEHLAEDLSVRLRRFPRIRDVDPNASGFWYERDRAIELVLAPDRARLAAYGLTVEELLDRVAAGARGQVTRDVVELPGGEVHLAVKLEGADRADVDDLRDLILTTPGGRGVRVADVATITPKETLGRIIREDQQYQRVVAYEFRGPRKLGDRVRDAVVKATVLPAGYTLESDPSTWEYEEGERGQLTLVLALAVALIYMVTAALFESYRAPLAVLAAVPLALIGVFLLYLCTGETFTREAWIGVVMMSGVVVNNAILVVDRIGAFLRGEISHEESLRSAGAAKLSLEEAAVRGTLDRVRPVLMTTVTTVLGFLPLVLFPGSDEPSLWNGLALATIGGLLASSLFVLTAIPAFYVLLGSATTASRRNRARRGIRSRPR